ncbi:uracil-DNA glycosylase [Pseudoroseomonas deserti]|uniref:Uracil-DNA glycosylase n=1 Tax=Teichococcus deserti TaxID=1817963 RepID=A0A1V2GUS4_9PROT|nr:uracil-DNA glycosylase family protein [Pseudoroseomonas deserti]ONG44642.1 uracil-DNA glycosylase [Pseudoroseomonas deserti]
MGLTPAAALAEAAAAARACRLCAPQLPLGPRPIFQLDAAARLLLVSQAPGTRAHLSGIPWNDKAGDRLRDWLGLDRAGFYGPGLAILPMGLCYPGRLPRGGDAPPRPECAPLWHPRLAPPLRHLRLTLLLGRYAIASRLGPAAARDLAGTVAGYAGLLRQGVFALPHPSWRTRAWAAARPWFEAEALPALRQAVAAALAP